MDKFYDREAGIPLGAALAAMPLEAPEHSAWPLLAARLQRPEKRLPRWPFALAASLLALAVLQHELPISVSGHAASNAAVTGTATITAANDRVELAGLMSESARLERLIAATNDDGASNATAAALSLEYDERLQLLDSELELNRDATRQRLLWQKRVQLLRNIAAVETSRNYLAAEGRSLDVALVSAF
jgi:hypothetical protein